MMGLSHAISGLAAGCATLAVVDGTADLLGVTDTIPAPPAMLFVAVVGGAALLPDIDHPGSTVARCLGPITKVLARGTEWMSLTIYHATRTPKDPPDRESGHRTVTHTYAGSAVIGFLATVSCLVSPYGVAAVCALAVGLLGAGTRRTTGKVLRRFSGLRLPVAFVLAVSGGVAGYFISTGFPGWSWLFGLGVAVGCIIHREGDWCTNSGVPRRLWPKIKNGRRWDKSRASANFDTGSAMEVYTVRPLLTVAFAVSAVWSSGVLPVLFTAGSNALAGVSP